MHGAGKTAYIQNGAGVAIVVVIFGRMIWHGTCMVVLVFMPMLTYRRRVGARPRP